MGSTNLTETILKRPLGMLLLLEQQISQIMMNFIIKSELAITRDWKQRKTNEKERLIAREE
ncbi:MAG: hypothetical protein COA74_03380 [Gammaproteobacteria bacterium]|nr:MAG: hypothetical protein COA74_03380 [Gammaproteobacteria bacterium]